MRLALLVVFAVGCQRTPAATRSDAPPSYSLRPMLPDLDQQQIAKVVEGMLGALSGDRVTVTFVADEQHVYRVSYTAGGAAHEVWVTRDGRFMATGVTDVAALRERFDRDARFAACLDAAGVRLFVDATAASRELLAVVGVAAERLAVRCDVPGGGCAKLGVTEVPRVRVRGELHPGPVTRAWLESQTACK